MNTFNPENVTLTKGSTRLRMQMKESSPYFPMIREVLKRRLADYVQDPRYLFWKVQYRYYAYEPGTMSLLVPINYFDEMMDEFTAMGAPIDVLDEVLVEPRKIDLHMVKGFSPKDDEQATVIDYMSQPLPYRKGVSTATGSGKTVSSIAAIVRNGTAAIVIVSGLMDQWVDQFHHFTDIGNRIYLVRGSRSLLELMDSEEKPDVIVFSLETLRKYILRREPNYQDIPNYELFLRYYGIGMKITDEVHMNFWTGTMIDLHSNVRNNIYLTATFTSSNIQTRRIFNKVFPVDMRWGESNRHRYINFVSYHYQIYVPDRYCSGYLGYSHIRVEKYYLKNKGRILRQFLDTVLYPVVNREYENVCKPGQKCLIYCATILMIKAVKDWLKAKYPNRKVGMFIGGSEAKAYEQYEIIVTNLKKAGTGTDIKNLYVLINTVSFKSVTLSEQLPGRLRKLPDGTHPTYVELVNTAVKPQVYHLYERARTQKRLAYSYQEKQV